MSMKPLIPYAGFDPDNPRFIRNVPVARAAELRGRGLSWKEVARELTDETNRPVPFTADGVYAAVVRARKKDKLHEHL
jgi:hypothetical protein